MAPVIPRSFRAVAEWRVDGRLMMGPLELEQNNGAETGIHRIRYRTRHAPVEFVGTTYEWNEWRRVETAKGAFLEIAGLCYPVTGEYRDMFAWVGLAAPAGGCGPACVAWRVPELTVEVRDNWRPLRYNVSGTEYLFREFSNGSDVDFFSSERCTDPPICEVGQSWEIMYRVHATNDGDVGDRNLGDLRGDAFFLCDMVLENQTLHVDAVSRWFVETSRLRGQYQNCVDGRCLGVNDWYVGRTAAMGLSHGEEVGQCASNNLTGTWFSLPNRGRCSSLPDARVGIDCTWRATRLKTISTACLLDTGRLREACELDARPPFTAAEALLHAAFIDDDDDDPPA